MQLTSFGWQALLNGFCAVVEDTEAEIRWVIAGRSPPAGPL
ncbi:MAG: hypothetical protein WKF47_02855 [Geodermatophilaceae bacterium]